MAISTGNLIGPARMMHGEGIPKRFVENARAHEPSQNFLRKKHVNLGNLCHAMNSNRANEGDELDAHNA